MGETSGVPASGAYTVPIDGERARSLVTRHTKYAAQVSILEDAAYRAALERCGGNLPQP